MFENNKKTMFMMMKWERFMDRFFKHGYLYLENGSRR